MKTISEKNLENLEEHSEWLASLHDEEKELYQFVMDSLTDEPEKWKGLHLPTSTMECEEYNLQVSSNQIDLLTYTPVSVEPKLIELNCRSLLHIASPYHRKFMSDAYERWLNRKFSLERANQLQTIKEVLSKVKK